MVLTISTNTSAINVQRNLNKASDASASSLAKLSSGSRVPTAKDDAASLAIGSRVEAEIAGLQQASVNASQATSLLQIADGAMGEINDVLIRQSTLAIQSSSGQLSDSERAIINSEFTQLRDEIDRIADDTEFNGNKLLKGGDVTSTTNEAVAGGLDAKGISVSYDSNKVTDGEGFAVEYNTTDQTLKLTNTTTGEVIEKDIAKVMENATGDATTGTNLAAGETVDITFADAGITVTLDDDFARAASFGGASAAGGALVLGDEASVKVVASDISDLTGSSAFADGKLTLNSLVTTGNISSADTGLTFSVDGGANWVDGGGAGVAVGAGDTLLVAKQGTTIPLVEVEVGTTNFAAATDENSTLSIDLSTAFTNTETSDPTAASFKFKVGTGREAQDSIDLTIDSVSTQALGTNGATVETQVNADDAIGTIKSAIDTLQGSRAKIGASLSRLDFASSNLSVAIENQSAAKSGLLDVDVASETTEYAAKQVVVQAGVSLLAQANQQPNQLLKLIG